MARLLQTMIQKRADKYKPQLWLIWKALQGAIDALKNEALVMDDQSVKVICDLIATGSGSVQAMMKLDDIKEAMSNVQQFMENGVVDPI